MIDKLIIEIPWHVVQWVLLVVFGFLCFSLGRALGLKQGKKLTRDEAQKKGGAK
jgi:hypothetical protein